jgi:hypothetical protein
MPPDLHKAAGMHEALRVGFLQVADGGIPRQLHRDALFT